MNEITTENFNSEVEQQEMLATRWQRLGASMIDALCILPVTIPVMYFTGGFEGISEGLEPSAIYTFIVGLLGLLVFTTLNYKLLISNGQTIGKKVIGIKIVDLDGELPLAKSHIVKRYAFFYLPSYIPVIGQFISTINILFVFSKSKRCLHDRIAGTRVVKS